MTEILIVIGLIVLIIALAVPAFNLISGSRSVDAGENLVSAMLGRARAEAIRNHRLAGVAIFRDPVTERTAMAIVVPASDRAGVSDEPAGLEEYKSWKQTDDASPPAATNYQVGDVVIYLAPSTAAGGKKITQAFVCTQAHTSSASTPPVLGAANPNTPYWGTVNVGEFDTLAGYEYQYLPNGVGAQTINDPDPDPTRPAPAGGRDRYLRNGIILFDGDGNLMHRSYLIRYVNSATTTDPTHLYLIMGMDRRTVTPAQNTVDVGNVSAGGLPIYSQMGVVLYDEPAFKAGGFTQDDPTNDNQPYTTATYNEQAEETWLDQNALSLMINRYNGTLIRGE